MSTTPWPSRTETPPLVFPLKAPRSETVRQDNPSQQHRQIHPGYVESFRRG